MVMLIRRYVADKGKKVIEPIQVSAITQRYREEQDHLAAFVKENFQIAGVVRSASRTSTPSTKTGASQLGQDEAGSDDDHGHEVEGYRYEGTRRCGERASFTPRLQELGTYGRLNTFFRFTSCNNHEVFRHFKKGFQAPQSKIAGAAYITVAAYITLLALFRGQPLLMVSIVPITFSTIFTMYALNCMVLRNVHGVRMAHCNPHDFDARVYSRICNWCIDVR
jgi:hypothetical protein